MLCHHSALAHSSRCNPAHNPHQLSPSLTLSLADSDCTLVLAGLPASSFSTLSQIQAEPSPSAGARLLLTKLDIICGPLDAAGHCWFFSWTSKVLHSQPSHPPSRIILTCPYGRPSPSRGHGLFPRPRFPICELFLFSVLVSAYSQPY